MANTIVKVADPARSLSRDMLINSVSLTRDSRGTIAVLDLVVPEAYDLMAEREPTSDDIVGGEA